MEEILELIFKIKVPLKS